MAAECHQLNRHAEPSAGIIALDVSGRGVRIMIDAGAISNSSRFAATSKKFEGGCRAAATPNYVLSMTPCRA